MNIRTTLPLLSILWAFAGCEEPEPASERTERCQAMCALIACDGGEVGPDQIGGCTQRCLDKWDATEEQSVECSTAYGRSVECFSALECTEFLAWDSGDASVCREPLTAFETECPGMAFDFRQ